MRRKWTNSHSCHEHVTEKNQLTVSIDNRGVMSEMWRKESIPHRMGGPRQSGSGFKKARKPKVGVMQQAGKALVWSEDVNLLNAGERGQNVAEGEKAEKGEKAKNKQEA